MGTYFSVRTEKRLPLFAAPLVEESNSDKRVLRSGKLAARGLANLFTATRRESVARAFTRTILETYWAKIQDTAPHPFAITEPFADQEMAELDESNIALAQRMGMAASSLEPVAAAYLISVNYTAMLPDETRSRLGAYYTPPPIAERLVSMATAAGVDWGTCHVLDPACGGGAFLSAVAGPLLRATKEHPPADRLANIASRLKGFEIDPFAAWLSQVFLEATLMQLCQRSGTRLPILVEVRNSLAVGTALEYGERYDLVIGNPPYGRVSLAPEVREFYRNSLYGHANLYGIFTDVAVRFARPSGIIAYVTPTSFLAGEYFKALRALLARYAPPVNIDFVSVRKGVFDDALQETALATYRKGDHGFGPPTVHFVAPTDKDELSVQNGGTFHLPNSGQPWLIARNPEHASLMRRLRAMPHRLKDYGYEVSTGPLVWNRHKSQLSEKPGKLTYPLIWAESVTSDGRFQFRAKKRNHAPFFKIRERDTLLVTRNPCVLLQRTTAKEQSRRLIAAQLPPAFVRKHGAVVVENHLNMIYPSTGNPMVTAKTLAAVLNTEIVDQAFRCISGSVAVSAYELENLPLPSPYDLTRLIGNTTNRAVVEEACLQLYT